MAHSPPGKWYGSRDLPHLEQARTLQVRHSRPVAQSHCVVENSLRPFDAPHLLQERTLHTRQSRSSPSRSPVSYTHLRAHETDVRIPFYISGPGIAAGQTPDVMAVNIDIAPTLLDLAGILKPNQMDGHSLLPLIMGDGASKARADFEELQWESGDERLCRACNVRDCCKCGASKGRSEFSSAQWDCATGRECRACNVRACSRCGRPKDPYHFPDEGEWEKNDRLCRSCKLPPSKRRSCAQCSTSLPQSDFSKKQWGKAANGKGRCKKCLGN